MSEIKLKPHQVDHFARVMDIMNKNRAYVDTSATGAGKTYIAVKIAQVMNLKVLVVSPKSLTTKWKVVTEEYGVELVDTITYGLLRGTKNKCNHPWLTRSNDQFYPTREFQDLVRSGVLVVFDEIGHIKNKKAMQTKAAHALARASGHMALISAMPLDNIDNIECIFKMLGIVTHEGLHFYEREGHKFGTGEYVMTGFDEVKSKCLKWDPDTTKKILAPDGIEIPITRRNINTLAFKLYTNVVKYHISSSAAPFKIDAIQDIGNGFYKMDPNQEKLWKQEISKLKKAIGYDETTKTATKSGFNSTTAILHTLETIKVDIIVREAEKVLTSNPNAKVIVVMFYLDPMNSVAKKLAKYSPLIMSGALSTRNRNTIMDKFQKATSESRLLITQIITGGEGIDLDDNHGDYPRFSFIAPTYHFQALHQATGRTYRESTKSKATIRIMYGQNTSENAADLEAKMLTAMARKSQIAKDMLANPDSNRLPFPDEYKSYFE